MLLYRYLSDAQYALDVLKNNKLKLSRYTDFNDPFDGSFCFCGEMPSEFAINDFMDVCSRNPEWRDFILQRTKDSSETLKMAIDCVAQQGMIEFSSHKECAYSMRTICFAECSRMSKEADVKMWGLYANKCRGARIELQVAVSNEFEDGVVDDWEDYEGGVYYRRIAYKPGRVTADCSRFKHPSELRGWFSDEYRILALQSTKNDIWAYEKEVRVFVDDKHNAIQPKNGCDFLRMPHTWTIKSIDIVSLPDEWIDSSKREKRKKVINDIRNEIMRRHLNIELRGAILMNEAYAFEYRPFSSL